MIKLTKGKIAVSINGPKNWGKLRAKLISLSERYECHAIFCERLKILNALIVS